jgi:hypothetical protein
VTSTKLIGDMVVAGADGALVSIFTATNAVPNLLSAVDQLRISGPFAHTLTWQSFEARFGKFTPFFNGVDAHMVPGFHLLDGDGGEIAYVHFWIAGKGVDLSTHDHGNTPSDLAPAFEGTWLNNGTGSVSHRSAQASAAPSNAAKPFSDRSGKRQSSVVRSPNGTAGKRAMMKAQSYDLVCAYEITAPIR